jgi:replicative superfamily II helicase
MDFSGLDAAERDAVKTIDPVAIFEELPKPEGFNDLYASQDRVLRRWFDDRTRNDTLVKLHTGGGKTLVGLLIALSSLREVKKPVLYICPNNELVHQTLEKAAEYSIPAVAWQDSGFPDPFDNCEAILVANYDHLFNGRSRFGPRDSTKAKVRLGAIIIDDAHAGLSELRDSFTYQILGADREAYLEFVGIFKGAFEDAGLVGSLDEVTSGREDDILEVPYWSWKKAEEQVRALVTRLEDRPYPKIKPQYKSASEKKLDEVRRHNFFVWPFLKNQLQSCHALVSASSISLTPLMPLNDLIPSYATCTRRVYMSATLTDDSTLVRTFGLHRDYNVASSPGTAGIAERFVISPAFMPSFGTSYERTAKDLAKFVAKERSAGVIVIAPSAKAANAWKDDATIVDGAKLSTTLDALRKRTTNGPFVLINRYDGLDLPKDACRLVVLWELPTGNNSYELYRAAMLEGGEELAAQVAQRLEQGMGRGARGASDYCIILFAGRSIERWIGKNSNRAHFTKATRAQYEIGRDVGAKVSSFDQLTTATDQVLKRDRRWITLHAQRLAAELANLEDSRATDTTFDEIEAYRLIARGKFAEAMRSLEQVASKIDDKEAKAWLLQIAARSAEYAGHALDAERLQMDAFSLNERYPTYPATRRYTFPAVTTTQSDAILKLITNCDPPISIIRDVREDTEHLHATASSNQFEESLMKLGSYLGFKATRPEKSTRQGPDVLWLSDKAGFILEAKSRKNRDNKISKSDVGQLLTSVEWFKEHFPSHRAFPVLVSPTADLHDGVTIAGASILTLDSLLRMRQLVITFFEGLATAEPTPAGVAARLMASPLGETRLKGSFLTDV